MTNHDYSSYWYLYEYRYDFFFAGIDTIFMIWKHSNPVEPSNVSRTPTCRRRLGILARSHRHLLTSPRPAASLDDPSSDSPVGPKAAAEWTRWVVEYVASLSSVRFGEPGDGSSRNGDRWRSDVADDWAGFAGKLGAPASPLRPCLWARPPTPSTTDRPTGSFNFPAKLGVGSVNFTPLA